jgi:hypothetical protein
LERLGVTFLRAHGARIRRDILDFHGNEQIDLELSSGGHTLQIQQVGRPRGATAGVDEAPPLELFESHFDGWPSTNTGTELIAEWLSNLPLGEAPPEAADSSRDLSNPFANDRPSERGRSESNAFNPFLGERSSPRSGSNPFLKRDRDREREEMLRRLRGEED